MEWMLDSDGMRSGMYNIMGWSFGMSDGALEKHVIFEWKVGHTSLGTGVALWTSTWKSEEHTDTHTREERVHTKE